MSLERKLLAALVDNPGEIARVFDMGLREELFEEPLSNRVFTFMKDYWLSTQMQKAPTRFVVESQHPGFILEVSEDQPDPAWLALMLIKRFATNNVQKIAQAAATTCHDDPIKTLHAMMADAYKAAEAILPRHSRTDMAENVEERRRRYALREQGIGVGVTLGLPELDDHTGKLLPGELAAIGAFSKVGKTMMIAKAAMEARRLGWKPIIFSLEMPVDEIEDRMDAMFSGVSYNQLSKRRLDLDGMRALFSSQDETAALGLGMRIESPDEGERTVAHLLARARHTGSNYVLIDQLSFMEETQKYPSEKQRQGSILKQLKNEIGRESRGKVPCVLAVQLRRESLERKEGPELNDFADAAEVERTCDLLLGLSRTPSQRMERNMRLDVLGGRRCEIASWLLKWDLIDSTTIRVTNRIERGVPQTAPTAQPPIIPQVPLVPVLPAAT